MDGAARFAVEALAVGAVAALAGACRDVPDPRRCVVSTPSTGDRDEWLIDDNDRPRSLTMYGGDTAVERWTYTYDGEGQLVEISIDNTTLTNGEMVLGPDGIRERVHRFDRRGREVRVMEQTFAPSGDPSPSRQIATYSLDAEGRVTEHRQLRPVPRGRRIELDAAGRVELDVLDYDFHGFPERAVRRYTYDAAGRPASMHRVLQDASPMTLTHEDTADGVRVRVHAEQFTLASFSFDRDAQGRLTRAARDDDDDGLAEKALVLLYLESGTVAIGREGGTGATDARTYSAGCELAIEPPLAPRPIAPPWELQLELPAIPSPYRIPENRFDWF